MQVFDTHRLLYKNAQIRAYSLATPTTPISFKDDTDTDIGNIVYTNENGYICRSSDMQTVKCLKLSESAIVQVSLDGGNNWPIEWVIEDTLTLSKAPMSIRYLIMVQISSGILGTRLHRLTPSCHSICSLVNTKSSRKLQFTSMMILVL